MWTSVPVQEGMDLNELKLCNPANDHGMYVGRPIKPAHQFTHGTGHILDRRRRGDRFSRCRLYDEVPDTSILPQSRGTTPHALDHAPMYLHYQSLGYRPAIVEVLADVIECLSAVEQLSCIFRVSAGDGTSCQDIFSFLHREACPLYTGGVMGLQQERARPHRGDPFIRETRSIEKPACTFDFSGNDRASHGRRNTT